MPTPPRRDARTLLFTGGLLLVPLAALWLLLNPAHDFRHGGRPGAGDARTGGGGPADEDAPADPGPSFTPAWPPPRLASGAPTQADWTLLALTLATRSGFQTPPAPLAPPAGGEEPTAVARNPFLQVSAGAVGLWIGVRGGVGVRTLAIPQDGRRHDYPFGRFTLVAQPRISPPAGSAAGPAADSAGSPAVRSVASSSAAGRAAFRPSSGCRRAARPHGRAVRAMPPTETTRPPTSRPPTRSCPPPPRSPFRSSPGLPW